MSTDCRRTAESTRAFRTVTGLLLAFAMVSALGCSGREAVWEAEETTPQASAGGEQPAASDEILTEAEAAWAQRGDEAQLRKAIELWEKALASDSGNHELWVRVARAYYFLGDGHISFNEEREEEMIAVFEKAIEASERALVALSPEFAQQMRDGARIEEAAPALGAPGVPALYWRSAAMGKWGLAKGFATILSYKDEIKAIMTHCLETDRDYFFSGPDRYFGAYYARVPAFSGGDVNKSKTHFDRSIEKAPHYLSTQVLKAQMWAVKAQDRAAFEEILNKVLATDPNVEPELAPENTIEHRRARALLTQADDLFE